MHIRMLQNRQGSPDGISTVLYKAGEVYDLPPALAAPWLAKGYCEQDKMGKSPDEVKDEGLPKDYAGDRAGKAGRRKK